MKPNHSRGYTLLELTMTVTIVGILASMAIPLFAGQTKLAHRAEAYVALDATYKAQVSYHSEFGEFAGTYKKLGGHLAMPGTVLLSDNALRSGKYTLSLATPWGTDTFQATATAQLDDDEWLDVVVGEFGRP